MLNEDLLRRVVKRIDSNRKLWDQHHWAGVDDNQYDYEKEEFFPETFEGIPVYEKRTGVYGEALVKLDSFVIEGMCGTSFCFAGHTILEHGDVILLDTGEGIGDTCFDSEGNEHVIEQRARDLLGLTLPDANYLFDGETGAGDFDKYKRILTQVTGVEFD